ncbi:MAG: hypothetical protein ACE5KZ_08060 [Candidatus Scalinduaceae bacterium]
MSTESQMTMHKIGMLNEKSLHSALKEWYTRPNDRLEVSVDGFHVDIVRGDLLVEIQVQNFTAMKRKIARLTSHRPVRLVHPITLEKWLVKLAQDGYSHLSRRKSPKRGAIEYLFEELVSFPKMLLNPNFSLEVLFIQEEEVRRYDSTRCWRRKNWVIHERRLLRVMGQRIFKTTSDIANIIPKALTEPFTTSDLAHAIRKPAWLAQKMAYCMRNMNIISPVGKRRNAILYTRSIA